MPNDKTYRIANGSPVFQATQVGSSHEDALKAYIEKTDRPNSGNSFIEALDQGPATFAVAPAVPDVYTVSFAVDLLSIRLLTISRETKPTYTVVRATI